MLFWIVFLAISRGIKDQNSQSSAGGLELKDDF